MPAIINKSKTKLADKDEWGTPRTLVRSLEEVLGEVFDLDPCATEKNAKCPLYIDKATDGLKVSWARGNVQSVFVNPPYSRGAVEKWLRKAAREVRKHPSLTVALLIPADTSTQYWRDVVAGKSAHVIFLNPRVKFVGASGSPNFASAVVTFYGKLAGRSKECGTYIATHKNGKIYHVKHLAAS